jgi:hypothetical protein
LTKGQPHDIINTSKKIKQKKEVMNMKCARELIAISLENAEKKRIREEQKRLERERAEAERLEILKKRAINWCEKVGEILEKKAIDAQPLEYKVILGYFAWDKNVCRTLEKVPSRYADKRNDYVINWNEAIYLPTIIEFFERYCFKVSYCDSWEYSYGRGVIDTLILTIKPAPQCF